jgi:RHS repeat-associated protein
MAGQDFIVIRLVPESPVDGTTFGTYLEDLSLEVLDANTGDTISGQAFSSPLTVLQWPPGSGSYVTVASAVTSADTSYNKSGANFDYGDLLRIDSLDGISIGSFVLSADQTTIPANGSTVSYKEYYPYGGAAYQAVRVGVEAPKRYRYTGKERDSETGFYYMNARYYLPWLARWASCDPAGPTDGYNLYQYGRSNPVRYTDPAGLQSGDDDDDGDDTPQMSLPLLGLTNQYPQLPENVR